MTRSEKIKKLANAIREYRGMYHAGNEGVWIHTPKKATGVRMKVWLDRLGLDTPETWDKIESFSSFAQFRAWIKSIEAP